jgi:lysophospholipase L1-like esterase
MRIILAFLTSALLSPALSAATFISADDPGILYTGRWDQTNSAEPWAFAKGTSVMANFEGTSVAVRLSATTTDYVRFIINGDAAGSIKVPLSIGTASYLLGAGVDKVEIVKETAAGRLTFHGFNLDNGESPGGAEVLEAPPSPPPLKLVFYGDSNLSGDSLEHEQNNGSRSLQGSYYGFAGIASRMLDAEYSNNSRSGASIRSLHASFDRIDWGTPGTSWYFPKFQPDAVIINIGANDVGRPKSKFKKDYRALLNDMRVAYPEAHIMLFNAWGWDYAEPANFIHEVIEGMGDENMSSAIFPWLFEQWHGCEYDHSGMAHVLVEHLKNVLRLTTPVNKADVMNGYGMNGDVANGGFEEVAPFGGFGWRYYTDAGVDRVEEPGPGSDSGEFFLRLEDGAAVHQPNPAQGGDTFTVTAWVRGSNSTSSLDTLHVTIDFRDQNMWTEPLETETFTFDLSTGWQEKTMTAIAPVGGSNPVFHTRLTFQAGNGSRVDIDDVEMRVGADACVDVDGDGYGDPGSSQCRAGPELDCNDGEASVNPGEDEDCDNDNIDDNCDGLADAADPDCSSQQCISLDEHCSSNQDCCSGRCSKGKPSSRACL